MGWSVSRFSDEPTREIALFEQEEDARVYAAQFGDDAWVQHATDPEAAARESAEAARLRRKVEAIEAEKLRLEDKVRNAEWLKSEIDMLRSELASLRRPSERGAA